MLRTEVSEESEGRSERMASLTEWMRIREAVCSGLFFRFTFLEFKKNGLSSFSQKWVSREKLIKAIFLFHLVAWECDWVRYMYTLGKASVVDHETDLLREQSLRHAKNLKRTKITDYCIAFAHTPFFLLSFFIEWRPLNNGQIFDNHCCLVRSFYWKTLEEQAKKQKRKKKNSWYH